MVSHVVCATSGKVRSLSSLTQIPFRSGALVEGIRSAVYAGYFPDRFSDNSMLMLADALFRIRAVAMLLSNIGSAALMGSVAKLITGTKLVVKQATARAYEVFIKILVALVCLLSLAYFIAKQVTRTRSDFESETEFAMDIIAFIIPCLLILGGLTNVVNAWKEKRATRRLAGGVYRSLGSYIAGIATIHFLIYVWAIIMAVITVVGVGSSETSVVYGVVIANVVVGNWFLYVVLMLIYRLGKKERYGLGSVSAGAYSGVPSNEHDIRQVC